MDIRENVPLAQFTTLEVGGPARYFALAETEDDVIESFGFAGAKNIPVFVLGGGSNVIISDNGFNGLVIHIGLKGIEIGSEPPAVTGGSGLPARSSVPVKAAAGENWDALVEQCVGENLAGIECLSGIPGTVGGTPVQNVGAYGQEISETIAFVRCYDHKTQSIIELSNAGCGFGYRKSIFNTTERGRYVVLSVACMLEQNGSAKIVYKDLIDHFDGRAPTLAETREAVLAIRRSKSMVIDKTDENHRSAGSFFKNPIVRESRYHEIADEFGSTVPHFPASDRSVKIPAAWLIEHAGFPKGYRKGNVGISTNHTLAIINRGGATAAEIIALKNEIQGTVSHKFGIGLVPEPIFVGEF